MDRKRTKEDYLNLLTETVKYYGKNPRKRRAISANNACVYKTDEGRMCAVGRCLDQEVMDYSEYNESTVVRVLIAKFGDKVFREEYQGFSLAFWKKLQKLHDSPEYWGDKGLTTIGKEYVRDIRKKIISEEFLVDSK